MTRDEQRRDRTALVAVLESAGARIRGTSVNCPWHEDRHASGSLYADGDGVWRFRCHACNWSGDVFDVEAEASGRPLRDVLPRDKPDVPPAPRKRPTGQPAKSFPSLEALVSSVRDIEAVYRYPDDSAVLRLQGKRFAQCHKTPDGWQWGAGPKPWALYRGDDLPAGETVHVAEGEKDADALRALGLMAVTSRGGAGNGGHSTWQALAGRDIVLWPDNDEKGRQHADDIEKILAGLQPRPNVRRVEIADLDLPDKGDVSDLIARIPGDASEKREGIEWTVREHARAVEFANADTPETLPVADKLRLPAFLDMRKALTETPPSVDWIFEDLIPRNCNAGLSGAGQSGKDQTAVVLTLSLAAARTLWPFARPALRGRVWYWNGEDPIDEMWRRFSRAAHVFNISPDDIGDRIRVACQRPGPLFTGDPLTPTPLFRWLQAEVREFKPDLVIVSPKAQFYAGEENDNGETSQWYTGIAMLGDEVPCARLIIQHVSKAQENSLGSVSARGASANRDDVRSMLTMAPLTEDEVKRYGIQNPRNYIRIALSKTNYGPQQDRAVILQRLTGPDTGGVLVQTDIEELVKQAAAGRAEAVGRMIVNGLKLVGSLSQNEIAREKAGAPIREDISEALGKKPKRADLLAGIEWGVRRGLIESVEIASGGGRPKSAFRVSERGVGND